ncbi:MAG TPA: Ada metal-binding domain-containing protein [Micropepsaceae bacterium]|nr:Ada metal-binding domain-containing protein [Micropepsaceae bacterium]
MNIEPFSWDRADAVAGRFDGKFLICVKTTGIYCLPSCRVRPPKAENVILLKTEEEAKVAGFRACKRCRPDLFYRGEDENVALYEGLAMRVHNAPHEYPDVTALAQACGVSQTKLGDLFREHAHLTPAAWLRRERVQAAARQLLDSEERVVDIGFAAGFESESVFHRQFLVLTRMTPGAYRGLKGASTWLLHLPAGYRAQEILAYHGRDPESPCERVDGRRFLKALATPDGPVVLEIAFEPEGAWCRVYAASKMGPQSIVQLQHASLKMLGLLGDVTGFETRAFRDAKIAGIVRRRLGLRVPLTATIFDALCWAIVGQQISVKFAAALRREILNLAGEPVEGGMRAHPSPERVADLDLTTLRQRRFSQSKAEYLIGAARETAEGRLDVEGLATGSASAAEKKLKAVRGIGTWTARYVMLRAGFADSAPIGDVALAAALQRTHALDARPDQEEAERIMGAFSPHRSLATTHLWASLKEAA